ncbi:MAG: hypothetical protein AB8G77_16130 [Rhodothermales bacterium]
MKRDKIFTRNLEGRMIEIGNWKARTSQDDAFIGLPLSDSGLEKLRHGRERGESDSQIFFDIHDAKRGNRPALALEELTIPQLAKIVSNLLEEHLESVNRMSKEDLIQMVKRLAKIKKVNIGFDIDLGS